MKELTNITKALADENRIRILALLEDGELCVCQIAELLQLAVSTISQHLLMLKQGSLVESRKEGRWIYYRLPDKSAPKNVRDWVSLAIRTFSEHERYHEDKRDLKKILKLDPEEICCRLKSRKSK